MATVNHEELMEELMQVHGQEVLQLVYTYVRNETIAEDLTQEIFVKCYKALPTFKGQSTIKTWLWRIAINHSKDYLKSWYSQRVKVSEDVSDAMRESVEQTVIQQMSDEQLADAVMRLPLKYREVIYLFYYEELTIKEMASILEIKENTIKTRLRKGKSLLKEMLEGSTWMND